MEWATMFASCICFSLMFDDLGKHLDQIPSDMSNFRYIENLAYST